jgi:hypothetical protein
MGLAYSVANEPLPNNYKENIVWGTTAREQKTYRGSPRAHPDVPCTSLQQIPMHLFRTVALSTVRRVGSLASHWL